MTLRLDSGWFRGVQALRVLCVPAQLTEDLGATGMFAWSLREGGGLKYTERNITVHGFGAEPEHFKACVRLLL